MAFTGYRVEYEDDYVVLLEMSKGRRVYCRRLDCDRLDVLQSIPEDQRPNHAYSYEALLRKLDSLPLTRIYNRVRSAERQLEETRLTLRQLEILGIVVAIVVFSTLIGLGVSLCV